MIKGQHLYLPAHQEANLDKATFDALAHEDHTKMHRYFEKWFKRGVPLWGVKEDIYKELTAMIVERAKQMNMDLSTPQINIVYRYIVDFYTNHSIPALVYSGMRQVGSKEYVKIAKEVGKEKSSSIMRDPVQVEKIKSAIRLSLAENGFKPDMIENWQWSKILQEIPFRV